MARGGLPARGVLVRPLQYLNYDIVFTHSPSFSVTSLAEILRQAIENEEKLLHPELPFSSVSQCIVQ